MYVVILDYQYARVIIKKLPEGTDVEEYVGDKYGISNTEYMTVETLDLDITT